MNDFTKSELAIIHLAIVRDMNQFDHILKTSPSMIELRQKLENMLDNYCEHEPSDPILVLIKKCIKCNQLLETRPWGPDCEHEYQDYPPGTGAIPFCIKCRRYF